MGRGLQDEYWIYLATDQEYLLPTSVTDCEASSSDDDSEATDNEEAEWDSHVIESEIEDFMAAAVDTFERGVTPEHLSKVWRISFEDAKKTIDVTSQLSVTPKDPILAKNYGTNDRMLRYKRIKEYFFMDTFFAAKHGGKSSRGHTCCQLFVTDKGFVYVVPMKRKGEVLQAIKQFAKEIGAPDAFIADMSGEQMSREVKKFCNDIGTTLRALEEGTPWSNKAELYIGLLKEAVRQDMKESDSPMVFWDYCLERRARIHNMTAKSNFKLHGTNAHTATTGEEGDISNLCQFAWYDWCYYREHTAAFPKQKEVLGRVLGPARGEGNEMCQWILKANGKVVPRRSVRPLQIAEIHSPSEIKKRRVFDELIERRHGTSINPPKTPIEKHESPEEDIVDPSDDQVLHEVPDTEDMVDSTGKILNQQPLYDRIISAEILLPHGDDMKMGKVIGRTLGDHGSTMGSNDDNPVGERRGYVRNLLHHIFGT
jgi:hypothetical protein